MTAVSQKRPSAALWVTLDKDILPDRKELLSVRRL
jgi:hypothetical protein